MHNARTTPWPFTEPLPPQFFNRHAVEDGTTSFEVKAVGWDTERAAGHVEGASFPELGGAAAEGPLG